MDELDKQIEQRVRVNNLKTAECQECGSKNNIYVCENGHKTLLCKNCLSVLIESNHKKYNKSRCFLFHPPFKDCNYNPLIPGGQGGIATNPFL